MIENCAMIEQIRTTASTDGPTISSYGPGAVVLIILDLFPSNCHSGKKMMDYENSAYPKTIVMSTWNRNTYIDAWHIREMILQLGEE